MIISLINWRIISSFSLIFSNKIFYHDKEKIYFKKFLESHFLAIFFLYTTTMSRLENKNIITNKIKIEISQLKIICYFFSKDFTASQTAKAINISRQTINNYYKIFREIAFNNLNYIEQNEAILNITHLKIYEKNIYLLQKENQLILLDKENIFLKNIQNELQENLIHHKKANSVRIIYNGYTKKFTILGYFICDNKIEEFITTRLKKFRGIKKENLYCHIKESFFRFDHTNDEIYKKVLTHFHNFIL